MSGRFGNAVKAVVLGALVAGSMLGASAGTAAARDDWRGERYRGNDWYGPGPGPGRGPEWRGPEWRGEGRRHWREPRVIYAPPPVIYAPPPVIYRPGPRVIYAPPPPPVIYAPAPGFGFSVNIR